MNMTDPVLYAEPGSSWWPVVWGPAFALVGLGVELVTSGPEHRVLWLLVGLALAVGAAAWVHGRRRICSVHLTPTELVQGREHLDVSRIAAVTEVGAPVGARVLGGLLTVPKHAHELPVRLDNNRVVLAWARDPNALREELTRLVERASGEC